MEDGEQVWNVRIRDNGIRTFVPPCYCYELVAADSTVVGVVSKIDLFPILSLSGLTIEKIIAGRLKVSGIVSRYAADATDVALRDPGTGFLIVSQEVV